MNLTKLVHSSEVKKDVSNAINLTEEYGVFTFPYVVIGGKYVLTASTLYNDDYGVAVLDFLVNKLEQERKINENRDCWCNGTKKWRFYPN